MRKKPTRRKIKKSRNNHYIQLYVICLTIFVITFFVTSSFLSSQTPCANSITCKSALVENIDNNSIGIFQGQNIIPPKIDLAYSDNNSSVLGTTAPNENKHIYVDLTAQKLYAYNGTEEYMQAMTATGRWGKTPIGNFNIWSKFRATRMAGGSGADYYNLPNVPYTMYFYGDFALHGAYWHNNFGHTMSHGCVNLRIVDSKKLFEWADGPSGGQKGTAVSVCNKFIAPNNCIQDNQTN